MGDVSEFAMRVKMLDVVGAVGLSPVERLKPSGAMRFRLASGSVSPTTGVELVEAPIHFERAEGAGVLPDVPAVGRGAIPVEGAVDAMIRLRVELADEGTSAVSGFNLVADGAMVDTGAGERAANGLAFGCIGASAVGTDALTPNGLAI